MSDSIRLDQTTTINDAGDLITALANNDTFILSQQDGTTKTIDAIELVKEVGRIAGGNTGTVNLAPLVNGLIPSQYVSHGGGTGTTFHLSPDATPGNTAGTVGDLWLSTANYDLYRLTSVTGEGQAATYVWSKQGSIRGTQVQINTADPSTITAGVVGDVIFNINTGAVFELFSISEDGTSFQWDNKGTLHQATQVVSHDDVDGKIATALGDVLSDLEGSDGVFFPAGGTTEDEYGRMEISSTTTEMANTGTADFSITFSAQFPTSIPITTTADKLDAPYMDEMSIISTLERSNEISRTNRGWQVVIAENGKLKVYLNEIDNKTESIVPSFLSSASVLGKRLHVALTFDRDSVLKIYFNGKLDSTHTISLNQGDLSDNRKIAIGYCNTPAGRGFKFLYSQACENLTLYSLNFYEDIFTAEEVEELYHRKNTPNGSDLFLPISYQSNFPQYNQDAWGPIPTYNHGVLSVLNLDGIKHLSLATPAAHQDTHAYIGNTNTSGNSLTPFDNGVVYRITIQLGKLSSHDNVSINGFKMFEGPIGVPSGGEITGHEIFSTRIPTDRNTGIKTYQFAFRKTTEQARLYIVATHNDSTVIDTTAGDSFEVRSIRMEPVKCLASYLPHNITHSKWFDRAARKNDISINGRVKKVKDEVGDHGSFTPSLGSGFAVSGAVGHYRLEGNLCFVHGKLVHDSNTQSDTAVSILGLPFRSHNHHDNLMSFFQIRGSAWNSIGDKVVYGSILSGQNKIALRYNSDNVDNLVRGRNMKDGEWLYFSGTYPLD